MNAGASAFFVKGMESGDFLAGLKAAAIPATSFQGRSAIKPGNIPSE